MRTVIHSHAERLRKGGILTGVQLCQIPSAAKARKSGGRKNMEEQNRLASVANLRLRRKQHSARRPECTTSCEKVVLHALKALT